MEMNEIISMATNGGVSILVIAFFMYRDLKFMAQLQTTLQTLVDTVNTLKSVIKKGEEDGN